MIETKNLLLRKFQKSDLDVLFKIQSDKNAMQYTFCDQNRKDAEKRFFAYALELKEFGFAPWTIWEKSENKIIGWGGLNIDPDDQSWGVEVAYFFHPEYWGRGFATELVLTSIEYGFDSLDLKKIGAFAHRSNIASRRVLEKCGFKFIRYFEKLNRNYYTVCKG